MASSFGDVGLAVLHVREPGVSGSRIIPLDRAAILLGRDLACDIVLSPRTVSRRHARITRHEDGAGYDLEDLQSTAGTWLNGRELRGEAATLSHGDHIVIGGCTLEFRDADPIEDSAATIVGEREVSGTDEQRRVDIRAEDKLRALLDITRELAGSHDPERVLDRILAALFRIFPQAERGLVLLREEPDHDPVLRACRYRTGSQPRPIGRFSRTVLEHVIDRGKAVLCTNITEDARFAKSRSAVDVPYRTMMCVPLHDHRGRAIGLLELDTQPERRRFEPDDLDLLVAVAGPVSLAIDNARLLQEAHRAREEALAASRAKDRFLAVLSHELRTPLTPALMAASSLLDRDTDPALRPALDLIQRNIEMEARLIDDLLDLTSIARGRLRLHRCRIDAHEVVKQALSVCQPRIAEADLRVTLELAAAAPGLDADPTRLQQIIWNLIQNSVKFTPRGGTITIRSRNAAAVEAGGASRLIIEVSDTGMGIEPEALDRIFDPFEQGFQGPQFRSRGLGLGLAISRSLAESHGGSLTARSAGPGRGASFTLELPVAESSDLGTWEVSTIAASDSSEATVTMPAAMTVPAPSLRVLLVEDNRDTLRSLALVLRARGHVIVEAETLSIARAALAREPFDLLISDIELPDGSGLDLMRSLPRVADAPPAGIAISGFGSEDDLRMSREAGFSLHLTKPIVAGQLDDAIRRLMSGRRTA